MTPTLLIISKMPPLTSVACTCCTFVRREPFLLLPNRFQLPRQAGVWITTLATPSVRYSFQICELSFPAYHTPSYLLSYNYVQCNITLLSPNIYPVVPCMILNIRFNMFLLPYRPEMKTIHGVCSLPKTWYRVLLYLITTFLSVLPLVSENVVIGLLVLGYKRLKRRKTARTREKVTRRTNSHYATETSTKL